MKPTALPPAPLPGLFCALFWGEQRNEARTFGPDVDTVLAAPDERAPLPLYGFTLEEEPYLLARRTGAGFRVFVPPHATVARRVGTGHPEPLPAEQLPREEGRPYVDLTPEVALHLHEGHLRLEVQLAPAPRRQAGARWRVALVVVTAVVGAAALPLGFLVYRPSREEVEALTARAMEAARERQEAERRRLEALYPTSVQTDGGAPDPREQVTLPGSMKVQ